MTKLTCLVAAINEAATTKDRYIAAKLGLPQSEGQSKASRSRAKHSEKNPKLVGKLVVSAAKRSLAKKKASLSEGSMGAKRLNRKVTSRLKKDKDLDGALSDFGKLKYKDADSGSRGSSLGHVSRGNDTRTYSGQKKDVAKDKKLKAAMERHRVTGYTANSVKDKIKSRKSKTVKESLFEVLLQLEGSMGTKRLQRKIDSQGKTSDFKSTIKTQDKRNYKNADSGARGGRYGYLGKEYSKSGRSSDQPIDKKLKAAMEKHRVTGVSAKGISRKAKANRTKTVKEALEEGSMGERRLRRKGDTANKKAEYKKAEGKSRDKEEYGRHEDRWHTPNTPYPHGPKINKRMRDNASRDRNTANLTKRKLEKNRGVKTVKESLFEVLLQLEGRRVPDGGKLRSQRKKNDGEDRADDAAYDRSKYDPMDYNPEYETNREAQRKAGVSSRQEKKVRGAKAKPTYADKYKNDKQDKDSRRIRLKTKLKEALEEGSMGLKRLDRKFKSRLKKDKDLDGASSDLRKLEYKDADSGSRGSNLGPHAIGDNDTRTNRFAKRDVDKNKKLKASMEKHRVTGSTARRISQKVKAKK